MRFLSKAISVLLHPLFLPTYIFLILLSSDTYLAYRIPEQLQWLLLGFVFVITFVFPTLSSYIMLRKGMIQSLEMETARERFAPYLITAIYFFACYFMLKKMHLSAPFYNVQLGAAVSVLMAALINYKWKISAHMTAIGGLAGVFFSLSLVLPDNFSSQFLITILVAGVLGSARLISGTHTHAQLYVGFGVGFFCEWVTLVFSN